MVSVAIFRMLSVPVRQAKQPREREAWEKS